MTLKTNRYIYQKQIVHTKIHRKILYLLAMGGKASLLKNLLSGYCQPEIKDFLVKQINKPLKYKYYGQTPNKTALMVAADYRQSEVVKVLIEAGADVFKSVNKLTAFDHTRVLFHEQSVYQVIKKAQFGQIERSLTREEMKNALDFCCERGESLKASTLMATKMISLIPSEDALKDPEIYSHAKKYFKTLENIIQCSLVLSLNAKNKLHAELLVKWVHFFKKDRLQKMFNWLVNNHFFAEAITALKRGGLNVNMKNKLGTRPIDLALLEKNNEDFLEELLKWGANPNLQDSQGQTPLYRVQNINQIKLLVDNGANILHRDNQGQTAYEYHVSSWWSDRNLAPYLAQYENVEK